MKKISILDGAIGTELILKGEKLPHYIWSAEINLKNPQLLLDIHKDYIKSGANYITANTFRTTKRAYKKIGLSDSKANEMSAKSMQAAIKIAKKAANKSIKVLGSIAPLEDCYSPKLFPGFKIAKNEFSVIAKNLKNGGVDGYIIETMNSIQETLACLEATKYYELPIWISFNLLNYNHIKSGETLENAINTVNEYNVDYILLNCNSNGPYRYEPGQTFIDSSLLEKTSFAITGSLFGLVLAYIIKSYALSNNAISSGMEKISSGIDDSARILKSTGWNLLGRIHFPLLKTSFFTSILLVTSEVVKELPATLILRPFNYDTLAVSAYIYAAEERMRDAAAPSIAIILVGLIPIIIITRMIRSNQKY